MPVTIGMRAKATIENAKRRIAVCHRFASLVRGLSEWEKPTVTG